MTALVAILLIVIAVLAAIGFGPAAIVRVRALRHRRPTTPPPPAYDPGRERRAETRARELLQAVVSETDYAMYMELGFIAMEGEAGYGYLLYPHRPIVAVGRCASR